MKVLIILIMLMVSGCGYVHFGPTPPILADSDIPHQMTPGAYENTAGEVFYVDAEKPRWSVSEGYLFEAVTEPEPEKEFWGQTTDEWKAIGTSLGALILAASTVINSRKRKKAEVEVKALRMKQGEI